MTKCFISYGANVAGPFGSPADTFKFALEELRTLDFVIEKKSVLYSSLAFPNSEEPKYLNGCLELNVNCSAVELLGFLKSIEIKMGRRENLRWSPRICDLDLLSYSNIVLPSYEVFNYWYKMPLKKQILTKPNELLLPHPRLQDRAFVLKPLMEFAADWMHPVSNLSVKEMFESLPQAERDSVLPI